MSHARTPPVRVALGRETLGELAVARRREWLVTNGIGGFACCTLAGLATRRYHGMLVAALKPPVARTVTLVKLDALAHYAGRDYPLAVNEYADGTVDPHGHVHLESFVLEGTLPVFTWAIADALLQCRIWMARGANTSYVQYTLLRGSSALALTLTPLTAWRDYHAHQHGGGEPLVAELIDGCELVHADGRLRLAGVDAAFQRDGAWYWGFRHGVEAERGLDAHEDLYRPGVFRATLAPGDCTTVIASTHAITPSPSAALAGVRAHETALLARMPTHWPDWVRNLALAADQYVVERPQGDGTGATLIAGYPWFTDWGRDTMIALPGLLLTTGRHALAAQVLRTFARHVSQGLLPNRFPDGDEAPEYNTVDATLWYFQAIAQYLDATGDDAFAAELYPVLVDIVAWHDRGTRYGIATDADGLLRAGEPGVQLTWMDAKVGERVITPRTGKPVEINALWHGALCVLAALAERVGEAAAARRWHARAARVAERFNARFWYADGGHLYDVIDGPEGADATLRPNQLIAAALDHGLLDAPRTRSVVDACARELLTSHGLRTLPRGAREYVAHYRGGPAERDGAYHQGTVWAWLIGPFVRAHLRAHGDPAAARRLLAPFASHLADACVGQVSEVFDADAPHAPGGCFAQAWSVAEILTAWAATDAGAPAPVPDDLRTTAQVIP